MESEISCVADRARECAVSRLCVFYVVRVGE
jgi:hypothetical protein